MEQNLLNAEGVFYDENGWCHVMKKIDLRTYTIEYGIKSGFYTEQEAQISLGTHMAEFKENIKRIKSLTNMRYTFTEYLEYWYTQIYNPNSSSSAGMIYGWTIYKIIFPFTRYDMLLGMVTPEYLNNLLKNCKGYCASAGPEVYKVLCLVMRDAVDDGYIKNNPIPTVTPYIWKASKRNVFNTEQLKIFLTSAYVHHSNYLEFLLGVFCGLRVGEVLGLKYSDFDEENQTVEIKRQYTRMYDTDVENKKTVISSKRTFKPPKSACSHRILKIPKVIFQELKIRKEDNERFLNQPGISHTFEEYVCLGEEGNIKSDGTLRTELQRICARNGLPRLSFHDLRHTFATILIEQGVPLEKISKLMGHKSVNTTFNIYCEIMEGNEMISQAVSVSMDPAIGYSERR